MRLQSTPTGQHHPRRGVTLVEMLVTLAVLLLMMTAIVQIFQAATGTLSASRAYQEIDAGLRRIDGMIRTDFAGVTAKLTPPNNPKDNRGYFEYGENAFADLQGEDGDDYVRFTTKAPPDKPFTGRYWPKGSLTPITITSQYAEVIYFLRNGNLYRRVLLVVPERQKSLVPMTQNLDASSNPFRPNLLGAANVSWQGMNDVSARPSATGTGIVLNSLGDLTNRENRAFVPRFASDFFTNGTNAGPPDGLVDDENGDGVPDFHPTLYPQILSGPGLVYESQSSTAPFVPTPLSTSTSLMAFPYIFPGAYSHPDPFTLTTGWLHSPNPDNATPSNYLQYLQRLNHNPLDLGDNLPRPDKTPSSTTNVTGGLQTWWGFPTWRESLSSNWTDPTQPINTAVSQPLGLVPRLGNAINASTGLVADDVNLLPPMVYNTSHTESAALFNVMRPTPQPYSDAMGGNSSFMDLGPPVSTLWVASWEDDLIMTGVRSFDIKALDNKLGDYVDLGWGDDARHPVANAYYNQFGNSNSAPFMLGNPSMSFNGTGGLIFNLGSPAPTLAVNNQLVDLLGESFAHEGRMPPLVNDYRYDAQFGAATYPLPAGNGYTGNIGNNDASVIRLRRVWDSWSTDYTAAPAQGYDPATKAPVGPPFTPPVYPSYPPPYPAALRGIQIQIRVQDPTGKYVKSLTIRQDFTDKL